MVTSLSIKDIRTYKYATLFILGNILMPQLCHLVPQGGLIFLPIYFFTLIAAYQYGLAAGLLTAVMSPLVNHVFFGMPPTDILPLILIKSILLATSASLIAQRIGRVTFLGVLLSVITYQSIGMLFEWAITDSLFVSLQDVRIGYPGILIQVILGFILLKQYSKR